MRQQFLEPMAHHLTVHGLGTASEIFDGDAPFAPRGCIAQAWTVAELLQAWAAVTGFKAKPAAKKRVTARVPAGLKA